MLTANITVLDSNLNLAGFNTIYW